MLKIQISWVIKLVIKQRMLLTLKFLGLSIWFNATGASTSNFFGQYAGLSATMLKIQISLVRVLVMEQLMLINQRLFGFECWVSSNKCL
jgi:hypothetical protein